MTSNDPSGKQREVAARPSFNTGRAVAMLAAFCSSAGYAAETYTIDPRHTFPLFEVSHYGFSTQRGRFERTRGKITIDVESRTGSIDVEIDAASISMGIDAWNKQMRSEAYFNTEAFPVITFRSNRLVFDGGRLTGAEGDFTLLGVTRLLNLTVANFNCGANPISKQPQCGAEASTRLKRSDFGMTHALPGISDEVRILIGIEATKD